jgi:hypothetical protein
MTSTPIVGVVGCGVTGSRVAAHLAAEGLRVALYDDSSSVAAAIARRTNGVMLERAADLAACDLVVMCQPTRHTEQATVLVEHGVSVVSIGDDLSDVSTLMRLHDAAVANGASMVIGAGMAPGLSGLLARYLANQLSVVDELHVALHGTAGPACARQHHDALGQTSLGWHDGSWIEPPGGSGRDLVWFPDPVQAHDCYRAALPDPLLLQRAFPSACRITARVSATRRDRLTARMPMITPPHAAGDMGSVRVEARGAGPGGERITVIAGASAPTADLAAATCAATAAQVVRVGTLPGVHGLGDRSLEVLDLLHHATRLGVRVQEFTGVGRATGW